MAQAGAQAGTRWLVSALRRILASSPKQTESPGSSSQRAEQPAIKKDALNYWKQKKSCSRLCSAVAGIHVKQPA